MKTTSFAIVQASVLCALVCLVGADSLSAQVNACQSAKAGSVACVIPDLINSDLNKLGLPTLPAGTITPLSFGYLDSGVPVIAGQLSAAAPLPSPASGFVYTFDPATGVFSRSNESYGPILSERSETMGAHRIFVGFSEQYFDFTHVDGIRLSNIPLVVSLGGGAFLAGSYDLRLHLSQSTIFGTYGLTNKLDVSVAIPILNSQFNGSLNEQAHLGPNSSSAATTINRSASGIGDVQFQVKGTVVRREHGGLALGVNVRTPTGDAYNLLGSGAMGIKPFVAASTTIHHFLSPHLNLGYQWNGKSVLAGDVSAQTKRSIPGSVPYAAGADIAVSRRVTIATDVIGAELIHAPRVVVGYGTDVPLAGIGFYRQSYNTTSASGGIKFNPGGKFLIVANLLVRLNHGGLSAPFVPLIGVSYVR